MPHVGTDTQSQRDASLYGIRNTEYAPRITGSTRLVGIIGWPVSHSRSPRMHNAAYAALGLAWAYVPLPVPPGRVGDAVRGLVALGFTGANVTVPHKQAVIPYLDELTPVAQAIGAVNTIVVRADGSLLGDSTDGAGFMADLRSQMANGQWQIANSREQIGTALVIGAGGAARAVVYTLAEAGATVAIANRTLDNAEALCRSLAAAVPHAASRLSAYSFPAALATLAARADLIVNTTSLGLHEGDPMPWDTSVAFRSGQIVYDLIYNRPTDLLALARSQGATALDGLGMLIHQGARSAARWTGKDEVELAHLMKKEILIP